MAGAGVRGWQCSVIAGRGVGGLVGREVKGGEKRGRRQAVGVKSVLS